MQTIQTAVERQQGTTAVIPSRLQQDSGAIQWIQARDGKRATFRPAMVGLNISLRNVSSTGLAKKLDLQF